MPISTRSFRTENCTKTMSVLFPTVTFQFVSAPHTHTHVHRHTPFSFEIFFLAYGFSGHSELDFVMYETTSFCVQRHHSVSPSSPHKLSRRLSFTASVFDVSFSTASRGGEALSVGHFQLWSHCVHSSTASTQTTTSACSYCFLRGHFRRVFAKQQHRRDAKKVQPGWACQK